MSIVSLECESSDGNTRSATSDTVRNTSAEPVSSSPAVNVCPVYLAGKLTSRVRPSSRRRGPREAHFPIIDHVARTQEVHKPPYGGETTTIGGAFAVICVARLLAFTVANVTQAFARDAERQAMPIFR